MDNHNYRTRQNIRQRRKRATDQAHTMTSTVVIIKQQEFLLIKPLEEVKKNKKIASLENLTTKKMSTAHIAQNIAETCQKYFQSFIAIEMSQHFCQILQNISLQHYNFQFLKYFCKQIFNAFRNNVENSIEMCRFYTFQEYFKI